MGKILLLGLFFLNIFAEAPLLLKGMPKIRDINWKKMERRVLARESDLPEGYSEQRILKGMRLIYAVRPKICVFIGPYGIASVYPSACALRFFKKGALYTVHPWCREELRIEGDKKWKKMADFSLEYRRFLTQLRKFSFDSFCFPLKMDAEDATRFFAEESIDILHIDCRWRCPFALVDSMLFYPRVKEGGFIWLDNVHKSPSDEIQNFWEERSTKIEEMSSKGSFLFQKMRYLPAA